MGRQGQQQNGRGSYESRRLSTVLAVAAGLLSVAPTDSFLSAPLGTSSGAATTTAPGLRRSTGESRLTMQTAASGRGGSTGNGAAAAGGGRGVKRLSATGVATEDNQGAVGSLLETQQEQQKEVSNNDMKPFVAVPRRDPRVWFDAIRDGALPRPEALVELSK